MTREYAVTRFQERRQAGKLRPRKTPVGMLDQFFISLVRRVNRMEKRFRVAGMNEDGNAEAPTFVPHRIETGIIDGDEFRGVVADSEPEVLQNFQATSAAADTVINLLYHGSAEVGIINSAPVEHRENYEPAGVGLHHLVDDSLQFVAPQACEDHDGLDVELVHHAHQFAWRHVLIVD